MQRNSIVWVVQHTPGFDYSPAMEFGSLNRVIPEGLYYGHEDFIPAIDAWANEYDPALDYIVLTGSPLTIGCVFAAAADAANLGPSPKIRVLTWDRDDRCYTLTEVDAPDLIS